MYSNSPIYSTDPNNVICDVVYDSITNQIRKTSFRPNYIMVHPKDYKNIQQREKNKKFVNRLLK